MSYDISFRVKVEGVDAWVDVGDCDANTTPKEREVIDAYGHTLHVGDTIMFVDKYKDHTDAGIYRDVYTEDNVQYGGGIEINNCPFCGENLR